MSKGRPTRFPDGHQISVLVPAGDFRVLDNVVREQKLDDPRYTYGDQIREWIHRGAEEAAKSNGKKPPKQISVKEMKFRRLKAIARIANGLAEEYQ